MGKGIFRKTCLIGLTLILTAMFLAANLVQTPVWAADKPITLRYGSQFPDSMWIGAAAASWKEKVEKDAGGRLKIDAYFGGTLVGNNASDDIRGGIADIAHLSSIHEKGLQLLQRIRSFIWGLGINDEKVERQIYADLIEMFPLEEALDDMKTMCRHRLLPYQLISKKPVRTLDDFKGLRIRTSPQYFGLLKSLGAEGINLPASELYISLQKGTVDATIFEYTTIKSFKLNEVTKYCTNLGLSSGNTGPFEIMNKKVFDKMPGDIQKVLDDSIPYWQDEMRRLHLEEDTKAMNLAKESGIQFFDLSESDMKKFHEFCYESAIKEAALLDKLGFPGTKILEETKRLAEKYIK